MRIKKAYQGTVPENKILDTYSTSRTDTYSCNYVNGLVTYSTNEKRVGTWIDGKPLYRQVIDAGNLPNNGYSDIPLSTFTSANKTITELYCIAMSSQGECLKIPYYSSSSNFTTVFCTTDKNIRIQTSNDRTRFHGYVIVEYTKTTD